MGRLSGCRMSAEGIYAALSPARGHCSWFLQRTNPEHATSMSHQFMKTIYAQTLDHAAYVHYLHGQYLLFHRLELATKANRDASCIAAVHDEALHRSSALAADLDYWAGLDWQRKLGSGSPATIRYIAQLEQDAKNPWLLLCHHFLQYNAALSGGQFLGKMVRNRAASLFGSSRPGGAQFYSFAASCQPTHGRVQQYIDAVDALEISDELREQMLCCMQQIYSSLFEMFDEAVELAPDTAGTSYAVAVKKSASKANPAAVPSPMRALNRVFSCEELTRHHANADQILVSLLGRVYDVSSGREFFGVGGPYQMFSGHDATYNLFVMSLKQSTLDLFQYEFDEDDALTIAEWICYFDNRYGRPIGLLGGQRHPVTVADLPRPTKIPFGSIDPQSHPALQSKL